MRQGKGRKVQKYIVAGAGNQTWVCLETVNHFTTTEPPQLDKLLPLEKTGKQHHFAAGAKNRTWVS